jgi:hypothetical protein
LPAFGWLRSYYSLKPICSRHPVRILLAKTKIILKPSSFLKVGAASLLLTLLLPSSAAYAADSSSETSVESIASVSEKQISTANSATPKFSTGDLLSVVKDRIDADREARDKRLAEEAAARAAAEESARVAAEEAARVEAERVAAEAKAAAEKAAAEKAAAESSRRGSSAPSSRSTSSGSSSPLYTGGGSKDEWLRASGIPESDWGYVDYIVTKESGWNPNATNASSGASGLVQALPCGKVPGSCFNPVDNLKWANGYAVGRYGSWAQAYGFWSSNHWW